MGTGDGVESDLPVPQALQICLLNRAHGFGHEKNTIHSLDLPALVGQAPQ